MKEEPHVICKVCGQPCYGGYATHIPCGGEKIKNESPFGKNAAEVYKTEGMEKHIGIDYGFAPTQTTETRFREKFTYKVKSRRGNNPYIDRIYVDKTEEILSFIEEEKEKARREEREEVLKEVREAQRKAIEWSPSEPHKILNSLYKLLSDLSTEEE